MLGFGLMPFGLGPYGLGTPEGATDVARGPAGSRYINPATRDYEQDPATGQLKQMPGVRQRVLIAVLTLKRSSTSSRGVGITLPRKMGTYFVLEMQRAVRDALYQLTDVEKVIRLDGVYVTRGAASRSLTIISYRDLTTGEEDRLSF